jgi:hypothetical protein
MWRDDVVASSHKNNSAKHWALLKSLPGKSSRPPPNQPISFNKSPDIARGFCKQFTSIVKHKSDPRARKVRRFLKACHKLDTSYKPFTSQDTYKAIMAAKSSSSMWPDGLTAIHLKHLGMRGLAYLTCLYYLSESNADLPTMWKAAVIVPVLKPGKPANESLSYRPISLLSRAVKVLEGLLLSSTTAALLKHATQHGFAQDHSCATALLPIATHIAIGLD